MEALPATVIEEVECPVKPKGATVVGVILSAALLFASPGSSFSQTPPPPGDAAKLADRSGLVRTKQYRKELPPAQSVERIPGVPEKNVVTFPVIQTPFEIARHLPFSKESLAARWQGTTRGGPPQDRDITLTAADVLEPKFAQGDTRLWFSSNASGVDSTGRLVWDGVNQAYHIWRCDMEGLNAQQITGNDPNLPEERFGEQRYPDSNLASNAIVYSRRSTVGSGNFDIYVRYLSTNIPPIRVNYDPVRPLGDSIHPAFSPGGTEVVFAARLATGGPYKLYRSRADGSPYPDGAFTRQLTEPPPGADDLDPDWSPDGSRIIFTRRTATGERLYMYVLGMPLDGAMPWTNFQSGGTPSKDRDPVWRSDGARILFASTRKARYDGKLSIRVAANSVGNSYDIYQFSPEVPEDNALNTPIAYTADPAGDTTGKQGATDPTEAFRLNWLVYVSDRPNPPVNQIDGFHDLWIGLFVDSSPPMLEVLPIVEPREGMPGQPIKIKAWVTDLQTGVKHVYAQFKDPDGAEVDSEGVEHRLYLKLRGDLPDPFGQRAFPATGQKMDLFVEIGQEVVNPYTYNYAFPWVLFVGTVGESDLRDGLQLFDDGPVSEGGHEPEGEVAGDNWYTNTWVTPLQPSDFYLDLLVEDVAGNQLVYDNISGFTTQLFAARNPILFVADYIAGQLFAQDLNFDPLLGRLFARTTWAPVESYWLRNPATHGENAWFYTTAGVRDKFYLPAPWGEPYPRTGETLDTLGPTAVYQEADIWRTQCRGPIPLTALAQYLPRLDQQVDPNNPLQTRQVLVAERAVVWAAPYAGDLWTERVGIHIQEVRQVVQQYLDAGGRLVLSGQDIAWALTQGGQIPSTFLTNYFKVQYADDVGPDIQVGTYNASRHRLIDSGDVVEGGPGDPVVLGPWDYHWPRPDGELDDWSTQNFLADPAQLVKTPFGLQLQTPGVLVAGSVTIDGAWNQLWIDSINAVGTISIPSVWRPYRYASGGFASVAATHASRAKTVFLSYGLEGVHSSHRVITVPLYGDVAWSDSRRYEQLHGMLCWMRTARAYGKVEAIDPDTLEKKPEPGVLVRWISGNGKDPTTVGQVLGAALTDSNGEYVITGLLPGHYFVDAVKPGFRIQHPEVILGIHGGQVNKEDANTINLIITKEPPGSVTGRVVDENGSPVGNVTVTLTSDFPTIPPVSGLTNSEGRFLITCNRGNWTVTVDGTAIGFSDTSQPPSATVVVDAGVTTTINTGNPDPPGSDTFIIFRPPGNLIGTVTSTEAGNPVIPGAQVNARITRFGQQVTYGPVLSDANGQYDFAASGIDLPAGNYTLVVSAFGFRTRNDISVNVPSGFTITQDVQLSPVAPRTLRGYVKTRLSGSSYEAAPAGLPVLVKLNNVTVCNTVTFSPPITSGGNVYNYEFAAPGCKLGDNINAYTVHVDTTGTGFRPPAPITVTVPDGDTPPDGLPKYADDIILTPLANFARFTNLISVPFNYLTEDPKQLLNGGPNFKLTAWDVDRQLFLNYPMAPADRFRLGRGYFLSNDTNMALTTPGTPADPNNIYPIAIKAGWNLIGDPFQFDVRLGNSFVSGPGGVLGYNEAVAAGWVVPIIWKMQSGFLVKDESLTLGQYQGAWFLAYEDVTLLVDPSGGSAPGGDGRAYGPDGSDWSRLSDGWRLPIHVYTETGLQDTAAFIGVSNSATDGFDSRYDFPRPPSDEEKYVRVYVPRTDWGARSGRYVSDVRGPVAGTQVWNFVVETSGAGTQATLRWPAMSQLPRNLNLVLVDEQAGKRVFMRSTSSYSFVPSDGAVRKFRIESISANRVLRITNPVAQATRSGAASISFTLSTEASVQVTVIAPSGKPVRVIDNRLVASAGVQSVTWDGRDGRGVSVPPGMYTIEVRATTEDGQIARAVTPVVLKR